MTLSYGFRLFCLLTLVAGLTYALAQAVLCGIAGRFMRRVDTATPRRQERILYLLQVAPALVAISVAGLLCFPEYLRHEPDRAAEPVGCITLVLVAAVSVWFGSALFRGACTLIRTLRSNRICRQSGRVVGRFGDATILALPDPALPLGLAGFFRPFILISENLLQPGGLGSEGLQVALDHERAHARQLDNWKLLSLCFLPRLFGNPWHRSWRFAADCAADEDATHGDPARSLLLAEALVRTARLVKPCRPAVICAALTWSDAGLARRVHRMVNAPAHSQVAGNSLLAGLAGLVLIAIGIAAAACPWIYSASEHILHLGGF